MCRSTPPAASTHAGSRHPARPKAHPDKPKARQASQYVETPAQRQPDPVPGPRSPDAGTDPGIHRCTDQIHGYPSPGSPRPTGSGIDTGSNPASRGNHSHSLAMSETPPAIRGNRTVSSEPSRYIALTVPLDGISRTGNPAHCGNCAATNRSTRDSSISTSSACIFTAPIQHPLSNRFQNSPRRRIPRGRPSGS